MNHAGEIAALTRLVRPHVAVVTAIAPAHIENFGSEEAIADAKGEIFEGLEPGGTAIIPNDSPHRDRLIAAARRHAGRILTFGCGEAPTSARCTRCRADERRQPDHRALLGARADLHHRRSPATHWVSNALAVLAAVEAVGGDLARPGSRWPRWAGSRAAASGTASRSTAARRC